MSCSKIFSGELPELTEDIIQYFRDDYSTLHSCVLVNRLWSRLAIPLLWEDPFSIPTRNYHFIEIYLHDLNEDDKTKLDEYGIDSKLFPSNTLFNYPSFIKYLDSLWNIVEHIREWSSTSTTASYQCDQCDQCLRLICKALLKTFIENEALLHTLIISDKYVDVDYLIDDCLNDFFELILQNPNFIRSIKRLKLDLAIKNNNVILNRFITLLSSNCNSISTLYIRSYPNKNYSLQIIKSQKNLKKITLQNNCHSFYQLLLSLKDSNCSNTLKSITFSRIDFLNIDVLSEVFEGLNVLESVHILNCFSLDIFAQQIMNMTRPLKLESLLMATTTFQAESLRLLLQISGNYLENIALPSHADQQLFKMITKYCSTKIKFLDLSVGFKQNIYLALDLIKNVGQNLNYLSFDGHNGVSSIVSQKLGELLPPKLDYLSLTLNTKNTSDFEVFLKNSHNTFINTLLICKVCSIVEGGEEILPSIEKYIMEKRRVKYLSFRFTDNVGMDSDWDLFYLKDVVKKFKLYSIEVKDYFDLCFNYPQHMKNNIFSDIFILNG